MGTRVCPAGRFASTDYASYSHINSYPGGLMCFIERTSNTGSFSTEATLSGFDTGDITMLGQRLICARFELAWHDVTASDRVRFWLTDGDNNHLCYAEDYQHPDDVGNNQQVQRCGTFFLHTPPAGTYSYKVRGEILRGSNGGPIGACSSTLIGYIMVTDMGPSF